MPKPKIEALTVDEVRRFLNAAQESRFHAAFVIAVVTGVRLGQVLALHWSDIELGDSGYLRRRLAVARRRPAADPRNQTTRSVRQVGIGRLGADALREHRVRQLQERLRIGTSWADLDLVFPNPWGDLMDPDWFRRRDFTETLTRAGPRKIRFHDLRHTFSTLQVANNQPVKIVSEMMGHTRTAITENLYAHVSAAMQRSATDGVDRLVSVHMHVGSTMPTARGPK